MRKTTGRLVAAATTAALAGSLAVTAPAQAAPKGKQSLASVLAADSGYDKNWNDFDILEVAVGAVLAEKPDSPVALLTDGKTALTAFLPTDRAFRKLVRSVTGKKPTTERKVVNQLLKFADVDTIETVLLYHVIPGKTLRSPKVVAAAQDGRSFTTAQGGEIRLRAVGNQIRVRDLDPDARNARVILRAIDINKGNRQIGHGIDRVLRPLDLPKG